MRRDVLLCFYEVNGGARETSKGDKGMERKILYINKKSSEQDKVLKLKSCAVMNQIKLVNPTEEELQSLPEDAELLKLIGFGKEVSGFLSELRKLGVRVDYKCVETETNRKWTLRQLYDELKAEHEEMQKLNGGVPESAK